MTAHPSTSARPAVPQIKTQAPGFYRMMLGDFEITALSDATAQRRPDELMDRPDEVRAAFARMHQPLPVDHSVNGYLINTGSALILVDAGAGDYFGPQAGGRLVSNLRAAGYQPEQVGVVLLTHLHGDHVGGLTAAGRPVFANAVIHVDRRDAELWLSLDAEKAAPAEQKPAFQRTRAIFDPYLAAGALRPFDGATELVPGIRSEPAYGHTPGHCGYLVESRGQRLLLWGDIVHFAEVQFCDPDLTIAYDRDRAAALAARHRQLALAAEQGYIIGGAHLSFPGLGRVWAEERGYGWFPLPYSAG